MISGRTRSVWGLWLSHWKTIVMVQRVVTQVFMSDSGCFPAAAPPDWRAANDCSMTVLVVPPAPPLTLKKQLSYRLYVVGSSLPPTAPGTKTLDSVHFLQQYSFQKKFPFRNRFSPKT